MKLLILFVAHVLLVVQSEAALPVCLTGIAVDVGSVPVPFPPLTCLKPNEYMACGYCDVTCFPQFCCGTGPCHYR